MNRADRDKLLSVLTGVHDFYGKEMSEFALQVWAQACETYDVEQVTKALSAHLMDADRGQFMPKPADIVRQIQGTNTDRSLIAWGKAYESMQRVGAYTSVCFDDAIIHSVIEDMGGWQKVCRSETDELGYIQKRFCDLYRAYAARGHDRHPAYLVGEHEMNNAKLGYTNHAKPTLIGNAERAKQVLAQGVSAPRVQITSPVVHLLDMKRGDAA